MARLFTILKKLGLAGQADISTLSAPRRIPRCAAEASSM